MNIPAELRYSSDHEWIRVDGNTATIGITEFAQDALGDVVYVDEIEQGVSYSVGDSISEVESTKSVSDIYSPLTGAIVTFNTKLEDSPDLLNTDPYGDGWICSIEMSDPAELDALMNADAYRALTEGTT
jgi:glycine cleavage system H protein